MNTTTTTGRLVAFHGDAAIKSKYLERVSAHEAADEILQAYGYWRDGKGCAVGCTLHSGDHKAYETELGVPMGLAQLQDSLFERLPHKRSKAFPRQFLAAITPGSDLAMVWPKWRLWMLEDPQNGLLSRPLPTKARKAIRRVAVLSRRSAAGNEPPKEAWAAAARAAWAAEAAAAWAAARAAEAAWAAEAAEAAAWAAAWAAEAAEAAAWAAAWAAAEAAEAAAWAAGRAAREKWSEAAADKLIELLREGRDVPAAAMRVRGKKKSFRRTQTSRREVGARRSALRRRAPFWAVETGFDMTGVRRVIRKLGRA